MQLCTVTGINAFYSKHFSDFTGFLGQSQGPNCHLIPNDSEAASFVLSAPSLARGYAVRTKPVLCLRHGVQARTSQMESAITTALAVATHDAADDKALNSVS